MKYEEIPPIHVTSGVFNSNRSPNHPSAEQPEKLNKGNPPQDKISPPRLDRTQLSQLDLLNSDTMDLSLEIRSVHQSIETIGGHLEQMKTALEGVVKIYPPYPPGSSERIEALRQFSTLRKMIDQIAQPESAEGLSNIMGDPQNHSRYGDWIIKKGGQGGDLVIKHQPLHTGTNGLNIPEMNVNSSDQQIQSTLSRVNTAMKTLDARRLQFIADANRVISNVA